MFGCGRTDLLSSTSLVCLLDSLPPVGRPLSQWQRTWGLLSVSFCVYRSFAVISNLLHVREMFVDVIMSSVFVSFKSLRLFLFPLNFFSQNSSHFKITGKKYPHNYERHETSDLIFHLWNSFSKLSPLGNSNCFPVAGDVTVSANSVCHGRSDERRGWYGANKIVSMFKQQAVKV